MIRTYPQRSLGLASVVRDFGGLCRTGFDKMKLHHVKRRLVWAVALGECFWPVKGFSALPAYTEPAALQLWLLPSQANSN